MLPIERLSRIKKIITKKKQIDVATLSSMLDVTEATIRRDLEKLENENFLKRTHGGAVLNEEIALSTTLIDMDEENSDLYETIGKVASKFIHNNEVIFLSPGISSRYLARHINDRHNLMIVTTDFAVAHDCAKYSPHVRIFIPGGQLSTSTLQLTGRNTDLGLKTFYFDNAFFDIDGVTLERGYSASSLDKAYIIQDVIRISKHSYALCSYNAFNTENVANIGNINMFPCVISNEQAPNIFKEYYFNHNIKFFATFDAFRS